MGAIHFALVHQHMLTSFPIPARPPQVLNNLCAFLCEDNSFTPRPCDFPPDVEAITIENLTYQPPSDAASLASTDDAVRTARELPETGLFVGASQLRP